MLAPRMCGDPRCCLPEGGTAGPCPATRHRSSSTIEVHVAMLTVEVHHSALPTSSMLVARPVTALMTSGPVINM